ncbi:MAG: hypothetical protein ACO31I_15635 [Prochlorotrichaceae cyanobacterium]
MVSFSTIGVSAGLLLLMGSDAAIAKVPTEQFATYPAPHSQPFTLPTTSVAQTLTGSPSKLLQLRIQRDLSRRLNVSPNSLQIIEATPQTWPDQCLGLARPYERCLGGTVNGWQVQVASAQQVWIYRSDRFGQRLKLEPLTAAPDFGSGDFSVETSRRLLETVAEQVNQPVNSLQILEVQSAIWDGCLGIYFPNQACTAIAMAGFRTLITDGERVWVYHLNENADQITQNATASGAQQPLVVSFAPLENTPEALDNQVVFQSQLSGDLAGSVQRMVLMADGKIYREQVRPIGGGEPTRELIKTLSAEEVEAFLNQLEEHRFPNLNRLRYLTEAAFADYPTTRLQASYASVEYIDLEVEKLPSDLREIVRRWNLLTQLETE